MTINVNVNQCKALDLAGAGMSIVNYIPLETTQESLISKIDKIYVTDSLLLIFDANISEIFVYNHKGQFINKIGKKGRGPKEYIMLNDVFFEESTGLVYAHERIRRSMLVYNLSGELLEDIPVKNHWFRSFCKTKSGYWVYSCYKEQNPDGYNLQLLDDRLNEMIGGFLPQQEFFPTVQSTAFVQDNENTYFIYPNSNIVYRIDEESKTPVPRFLIDFGYKTIPYGQISEISDIREYNRLLSEKDFLGNITNFHFCENRFYFSFFGTSRISTRYSACYDLITSEVQVFDRYTVFGASDTNPFKGLTFTEPVGVYGNQLIYQILPGDLQKDDLAIICTDTPRQVDVESNPVLFFLASNSFSE